jgi:hypothetical protein
MLGRWKDYNRVKTEKDLIPEGFELELLEVLSEAEPALDRLLKAPKKPPANQPTPQEPRNP